MMQIALSHEDATKFTISFLRKPLNSGFADYGYDLYVHNLMYYYLKSVHGIEHHSAEPYKKGLSVVFMDACWELCRRGILRPDTRDIEGQGTTRGAGYSLTAFGKKWLQESNLDDVVPTEPERFGEMLAATRDVFVPVYHQRAQEAVRCCGAHAYLACLTMCGAAAEAILLSIANNLGVDAKNSFKTNEMISRVIDKSNGVKHQDIQQFTGLLKYWRDEGMHGELEKFAENEAFTSMALLLRFAIFAKEKWFSGSTESPPKIHVTTRKSSSPLPKPTYS